MFRLSLLLCVLAAVFGGAAFSQENRGYLGVDLQDVTKEEADKLGWEAPRGVRVAKLREGSPGATAGILADDIITSLEGQDVENVERFMASIGDRDAGATVKLRLMRAGRERTVSATLGARPLSLAAEAGTAPQLVLDTGGHMAPVTGLAFTPDSKQLVSASNDRTVRVWDMDTGRTARIIRGESAPGWGSIYAMALSPDGRWLAVGGYLHGTDRALASAVRLHDFASGKVVALLKGHDEIVGTLAFSPDSKRLISASLGERAAIIWDLTTRQQALRLSGHAQAVTAVAFTSDGDRTVTGSKDDTLRLWSAADGKLIAEMRGHAGGVGSVAVSPAEELIASGGTDGRILLWDARTGALLRQLFKSLVPWSIRSLSFSPDGQRLLSASGEGCQTFDVATGREFCRTRSQLGLSCNGAIYSPDGRLAASHYNADVHVMDVRPTLAIKRGLRSTGASIHGVGFASDGQSIAWGGPAPYPDSMVTHRLRLPLDGKPLTRVEGLPAQEDRKSYLHGGDKHDLWAVHKQGPWSVEVKRKADTCCLLDILKDGKLQAEINTDGGRLGRGIALLPDQHTVLLGMAPGIRAYDLSGPLLGEFVGHFGEVRSLAPSPDGRFLVSGSADQTVRLWNLKTRELIVTLFHGSDGEWVMWTPQGYYTGSPGADKIVGWQINKGPENAADYVGADQLRTHLNRPDIVDKAIILASAEQAVRESPGTSFKLADLLSKPVPRFRIVSPAPGSAQRGGRVQVKIAIEAVPDPIKALRVQVNGRQVSEITPEIGSGGLKAGEHVLDVPLGKGRNEVRITLSNGVGEKAETRHPQPRGRRRPRQARHAVHPGHRRRPLSGAGQYLRAERRRQLRPALLGCRCKRSRRSHGEAAGAGAQQGRQARAASTAARRTMRRRLPTSSMPPTC